MSSDFCIKCDGGLSLYCGPCMDEAREALERAERERDTLVRMLVSEFGWKDTSYLHAMMHVENAVRNLRTDLSVAEEERDGYKLALKHTEDALKRHREERDDARAELERVTIDKNHAERRAREYLLAEPPEIAAARREGAEEMREAAAQVFDEEARAWGERLGGVIPKEKAAMIRALPLPGEETP